MKEHIYRRDQVLDLPDCKDKRPTVALIWGGRGYERDVSRAGMENILPLIDRNRYNALSVEIAPDGRWLWDEKEVFPSMPGGFRLDGGFIPADCAFPLLHGDFGEDGRVQGALDCAGISYVGCDTVASGICRDKIIVKAVADSLSIPTLPAVLVLRQDGLRSAVEQAESEIGYPAFVKPCALGSSIGASQAHDRKELISALKGAFALTDRVMVERLLAPKRELECGFLSIKGKELFTDPGEIILDGLYDYGKKYSSDGARAVPAAKLDRELQTLAKDYSRRLARRLGVRDIARVDFFLSDTEIYFNEINTMPGQTESSLYAKMLEREGISHFALVNSLISEALSRR